MDADGKKEMGADVAQGNNGKWVFREIEGF